MADYTITTTDQQETALVYAYEQSRNQPPLPGVPPLVETQAQYLQRRVTDSVLTPMVYEYGRVVDASVMGSISTIPPENREAAAAAISDVIVANGGTVFPIPGAPTTPPELTLRRRQERP